MTLICLASSVVLLTALGYEGDVPKPLVLATLLALGALVGPVQPINAELAVEVSYPADENAIEALQQLSGNLFSALLLPIAERAGEASVRLPGGAEDAAVRGDYVLLGFIALAGCGYFSTFDAPLKRSSLDCDADNSCELVDEECDVNGCEIVYLDEVEGKVVPSRETPTELPSGEQVAATEQAAATADADK